MFNCIVILSSWFATVMVLYLTEFPTDMVLNSLALYFIVDLDDEAVYFGDYKKLANWIELEYDDFIDEYYNNLHEKKRKRCTTMNGFSHCCIKVVHFIGNRS